MPIKLGIIGGGVMGEALLSRLLAQQLYQPDEVLVSELLEQRRDGLAQQYGIRVTANNQAAAAASEVLLLAIKPQVFEAVAAELAMGRGDNGHSLGTLPMVISILAGVPLERLENAFPSQPVIRAMPNTPATVGAGITALAAGKWVSPDQMEQAKTIFRAVGEVVEIPEHLMDAVTGLSGSGPAYVAILIEALADGGVAAGLPRAIALQLAKSTVLGTAQLLQETQIHPAQLKDRVTSPGGTTIAAIAKLEKAGFRSALIEAVLGSYQRSRELGS
ncbi:MAG: pyrroline-5-carboxylate reductase [Moorea sp. SIO4G2]|uniref:pyrroline-5-carboxylate reductase n=2 Tax=Moorena TaxID=1155738 RepID=UPI0013F8369B|nr:MULTISPECIES: pyrroline-5-carboxylate reductase [unclassified Moorena]NEO11143.1 pyrroline-5-carboxylate reductase [Moorena sp. SIO3E8]NEO63058.1 pyrroline-5-carboxylate reductase [Moorena sp. SIO4G2]NEP98051.1 pyrroline-5-carboxylate reductase [Moorena sp. SIO3F7]